ncbi:BgTH12-07255 [Blumeria graminis f. sp. triticale]|uniref:Autophagy-related protein 11 n=1 Tax=Blumeria graminis f. sp. triticale TaxID=1689686 RepID=A0A9W4D971_BLUGR|nr:BgTH12-07255 [Blumeria graminis f. sp. triticale]
MSMKVYIAHSGQCLLAEAETFNSLDSLKLWISKNSRVDTQDQIALNSHGKHVKFDSFSKEKEIFIFDRRIIQSTSTSGPKTSIYDNCTATIYQVSKPPESVSDHNDIEAWKDLLKNRQEWARSIATDCLRMLDEVRARRFEMDVIIKSASTAARNIQKHIIALDNKNVLIQSWVEHVRKVQGLPNIDWDVILESLRTIVAGEEIINFITRCQPKRQQKPNLGELIDIEKFNRAKMLAQKLPQQLLQTSVDLRKKIDEIYSHSDRIFDIVSKEMPDRSQEKVALEPVQISKDVEALSKKLYLECDSILQIRNSNLILQASNSTSVHTKTIIPNLMSRTIEIDNFRRQVTNTRNSLASQSIEVMQRIAFLTSMITDVTARLTAIEPCEDLVDAVQTLTDVKSIPVTYASFLAEGIRRKRWNEKIETELSTLTNEMALFREEETKRRCKWQKNVGSVLWGEKVEQNVSRLTVKVESSGDDWPEISKQHLTELLEILQASDSQSSVAIDVSNIISSLDNPTKSLSLRAKVSFKAGSLHENSLGNSRLLFRGDPELVCILQEENEKTTRKLKTAESRVRRLENLLHQQTQVNRMSLGNFHQVPSYPTSDPSNHINLARSPRLPEVLSRRSSISSWIPSTNQGNEDKSHQQRISSLENELCIERERSMGLERKVLDRKIVEESLRNQFEETNSTKRDLLQNFEAQQREFTEERKSLISDIKKLKAQKEDLEEELDRYVDIRDGEKIRIYDGENSLPDQPKAQYSTKLENQKLPGVWEFSGDSHKQVAGERKTKNLVLRENEDSAALLARAEKAEKKADHYFEVVQNLYKELRSENFLPENNSSSDDLIGLYRSLFHELQIAKNDARNARADHDITQIDLLELRGEIKRVKNKLSVEELDSFGLRESLAEKSKKVSALETKLTTLHLELTEIREKFAETEKEMNTLNTQLEEERLQVSKLMAIISQRTLRIETLEEEVRAQHEKNQSAQNENEKLLLRLESRTSKAKDLSHRVYFQNDRLCRLLERLSYSVTREGRSMLIQRLPRLERSNVNDSPDVNTSIRQSFSDTMGKKLPIENSSLGLVNWIHNDDLTVESDKFTSFLSTVGNLDVEAFCDTLAKRVKDLEYTAKKYSRDARSYREKSHFAQKEAHEKIAFKNFREGDLALFLPTRNQATGAWAAFNVGAPHYFLKEQDSHKLRSRDWLLARIHRIEHRVVDLSKSPSESQLHQSDRRSFGETSAGGDSFEDDNPFDLSDGLRWYLIYAAEEKLGAPTTPGLGKSTVASAHIDATGSIRRSKKSSSSGMDGINRTLSKNLDTRRGSSNSKKSLPATSSLIKVGSTPSDTVSLKTAATTRKAGGDPETHTTHPVNKEDEVSDRILGQELES